MRTWIEATGNHMWRFYYSRPDADPSVMTDANREQWEACHKALEQFSATEKEIIQMYYTSDWKNDLPTVKDFSARTGIAEPKIWKTLKAAKKAVLAERGLIDNGAEEV